MFSPLKPARALAGLFSAALLSPLLSLSATPAQAAATCGGVRLSAGSNVASVVNSKPSGTTFCFASGTYRLTRPIRVKSGDSFIGQAGAIISGSQVIGNFTHPGAYWVASNQTQAFMPDSRFPCKAGYTGCQHPEAVFMDQRSLWQVTTLKQLSSGEFYFDQRSNNIYLADNPSGHVIETTKAEGAIEGAKRVPGVTVADLTIQRFATTSRHAAVDAQGGRGWVIRGNDIQQNSGPGVMSGTDSKLLSNYIHHNGRIGIIGAGSNLLADGNEVAYNDTDGFSGWAAGGSKWHNVVGVIIRNNNFHDNSGQGIWTDISAKNILIEGNRSVGNGCNGIDVEVSYTAVVRNNVVSGNGCRGIFISGTPDVDVYGNDVSNNTKGGITLYQGNRGFGPYGPHQLKNVTVHDNSVSMSKGVSGMIVSAVPNADSYFSSRNIHFTGNHYRLKSLASKSFLWKRGLRDRGGWQSFGHDRTGTFSLIG